MARMIARALHVHYNNDVLHMDAEMSARNAPLNLACPVECVIGERLNHFSLVDEFARPDSRLTRQQLSLLL